jgi:excisionase family DNA binding protein
MDRPQPSAGEGRDGELAEPLLDADAVAVLLAVKPSWVYEAVRSKGIPHLRIGRHIRFTRSDLAAWIENRRQLAEP